MTETSPAIPSDDLSLDAADRNADTLDLVREHLARLARYGRESVSDENHEGMKLTLGLLSEFANATDEFLFLLTSRIKREVGIRRAAIERDLCLIDEPTAERLADLAAVASENTKD